jgi:hypothetical protein
MCRRSSEIILASLLEFLEQLPTIIKVYPALDQNLAVLEASALAGGHAYGILACTGKTLRRSSNNTPVISAKLVPAEAGNGNAVMALILTRIYFLQNWIRVILP